MKTQAERSRLFKGPKLLKSQEGLACFWSLPPVPFISRESEFVGVLSVNFRIIPNTVVLKTCTNFILHNDDITCERHCKNRGLIL